MIDHGVTAGERASHLTSVHYHLALAACDRSGLYDVGHSPTRIAGDVQAFMQKITVAGDPTLLGFYPKAWAARTIVHTTTQPKERLVIHVPGDPQKPFDDRQVENKFRRILTPVAAVDVDRLLLHAAVRSSTQIDLPPRWCRMSPASRLARDRPLIHENRGLQ